MRTSDNTIAQATSMVMVPLFQKSQVIQESSEILSYTIIFENTTRGRNCDGCCHLFLLVVFYGNKYSFVSMRIFTLTRFLKRNSVFALRWADKHADR